MKILSGWKEISTYMEHGIRTVQRWEHIGLPVHRPKGVNRSAVVAFREELDAWAHATPVRITNEVLALKANIAELQGKIKSLEAELLAIKRRLQTATK